MGHKPKDYYIENQTAGQGLARAEVLVLLRGHTPHVLAGTSRSTRRATSPPSCPSTCQNTMIEVPVPLPDTCAVLMGGKGVAGAGAAAFAADFLD